MHRRILGQFEHPRRNRSRISHIFSWVFEIKSSATKEAWRILKENPQRIQPEHSRKIYRKVLEESSRINTRILLALIRRILRGFYRWNTKSFKRRSPRRFNRRIFGEFKVELLKNCYGNFQRFRRNNSPRVQWVDFSRISRRIPAEYHWKSVSEEYPQGIKQENIGKVHREFKRETFEGSTNILSSSKNKN